MTPIKREKEGSLRIKRETFSMEMVLFTAFSSIVLLYSLKAAVKRFRVIEVIILCVFNSFVSQHLNFKIFSAFDRLSVKEELIPRVESYLHYGLFIPIILMWVLYLFRSGIPVFLKMIIALTFIGMDVAAKYFFLQTGMLTSRSPEWYPMVDVCITAGILLLSIIFMISFSLILKKELVFVD